MINRFCSDFWGFSFIKNCYYVRVHWMYYSASASKKSSLNEVGKSPKMSRVYFRKSGSLTDVRRAWAAFLSIKKHLYC